MRLYPETYRTTDGIWDRSEFIWSGLIMMFIAYPIGFIIGVIL